MIFNCYGTKIVLFLLLILYGGFLSLITIERYSTETIENNTIQNKTTDPDFNLYYALVKNDENLDNFQKKIEDLQKKMEKSFGRRYFMVSSRAIKNKLRTTDKGLFNLIESIGIDFKENKVYTIRNSDPVETAYFFNLTYQNGLIEKEFKKKTDSIVNFYYYGPENINDASEILNETISRDGCFDVLTGKQINILEIDYRSRIFMEFRNRVDIKFHDFNNTLEFDKHFKYFYANLEQKFEEFEYEGFDKAELRCFWLHENIKKLYERFNCIKDCLLNPKDIEYPGKFVCIRWKCNIK